MQYINEQGEFFTGDSIVIGDTRYISPSAEILAQAGYLPYTPPAPTEEELLYRAKINKIEEINMYDASKEVFTIDELEMWLGHELRLLLKTSVEAYIAMGRETVTKWFNGQEFTFPCTAWLLMLAALEIYASEVLNVTERHKAIVNLMDNIEDIEQYDYTEGYPNELVLSSSLLARSN